MPGRHHSSSRTLRSVARSIAAPVRVKRWTALVLSLTLMVGVAFGAGELPASAFTFTGFTKVYFDPSETPTDPNGTLTPPVRADGSSTLPATFHADFTIADGTAANATFALQLPDQFTGCVARSFEVKDPQGNVLGTASVDPTTRQLSVVTTAYAQTHTNVAGTVFYSCNFTNTPPNATTVWDFHNTDGSHSWDFSVQPILANTGSGGFDAAAPNKFGGFTTPDQGRTTTQDAIQWFLATPINPQPGFTITDVLTPQQNQFFDCPTLTVDDVTTDVTTGVVQSFVKAPATAYTVSCNPTSLTLTFTAAPAGNNYHASIMVNLGTPTGTGAVTTFKNTAHFQGTISTPSGNQLINTDFPATLTQERFGGQGTGDGIVLHKYYFPEGLPAGDHDTAPGKLVAPNTDIPVTITITNTGSTTLTNLVVTDQTASGPALTNLSCDFGTYGGAGATATTAPNAAFAAGATFSCSGTLNLPPGTTEQDTASVTATGDGPVQSSNPFNSYAPNATTQAAGSATPLTAGTAATAHDAIATANTNGASGTYAWELWFAQGRSCASMTAADWTAVAGVPSNKLDSGSVSLAGDGSFPTGNTVVPRAGGCLGYRGTVSYPDAGSMTLDLGAANETLDVAPPAATQPNVATQISPTGGAAPGAQLTDSFSVSGLGPVNPVTGHWYLKLFPGASSCAGLDWSDPSVTTVDEADQPIPGDVPAATPITVSSKKTSALGCYTFVWSLPASTSATNPTVAYTTEAGLATESVVVAPSSASATTTVSAGTVVVSGDVSDSIVVSGTSGASGTYTATLYGPVPVPAGSADCSKAIWTNAAAVGNEQIAITGDATYQTKGKYTVSAPAGTYVCYSFGGAFSGNLTGSFAPGVASESVLVTPSGATLSTTVSAATGLPGVAPTDDAVVGGLAAGATAALDWSLGFVPADPNGTCSGVTWGAAQQLAKGTVQAGNGHTTIDPKTSLANPGCYSFADVLHAPTGDVSIGYGTRSETITIAANQTTVSTRVGAGVVSVGDSITDVVTVSGLGAGNSAGLSWEVRGPLVPGAGGSCSGLDWSSAPTLAGSGAAPLSVQDGQVTIGDGTSTPVIAVGAAGCYAFGEVLAATATTASATSDFGAANEQVSVAARAVGVSTNISAGSVTPGGTVTDTITVSNAAGLPVTVNWTLVGPVAAPASGDCSTVDWSKAPATPVDSGTVSIPAGSSTGQTVASKPLVLPGCYSYTDQIVGSSAVAAKTVGAGADFEMVLVGVVSPSLSTSISQTSGQPPVTVQDTVSVSGTLENTTAHSTLYGPVAAPAGGCAAVSPAQWQAAAQLTQDVSIPAGPAVQQVKTADVSLTAAGCYSYGDVLDATGTSSGQRIDPGTASETITVAANVPQIDTQVTAATVAAGGTVQDTITPANTGGASVDVTWTLVGPVAPVNNSCATVDWSSAPATPVATGTVTGIAPGTSGKTTPATVLAAGCYSFTTAIAADPSKGLAGVSEPAGRPNEVVQASAGQPTVSTAISATTGKPGDQVHDSITVTGLLQNSTVHSTLYGPVAVPASGNCADITVAQWKAGPAQPAEDFPAPAGSTTPISTATATLSSPGCYSYGDVLDATTSSQATTLNPGDPTETIKVDPFVAGFSTQVNSAALTSGQAAQDTVMVGNTGGTRIDVSWTLVGPVVPVNGACAGVDWSTAPATPVATGTATIAAGTTSAKTGTTTLTTAGCYSYTDSFPGNGSVAAFTVAAGAAHEVIQVSTSQPAIGTTISQSTANPGVKVHDTVQVSGLIQPAALHSTLYGPVTPPAGGSCASITLAQWTAAATVAEPFTASAPTATITTADQSLALPGCYSYGDVLDATATSNAVTSNPGNPLETIFVDANLPGLTTRVSQAAVSSGQSVIDTITITNAGAADVDVTWNLVGPVAPVNGSCATVAWSTLLPAPQTVASGVVTIKAGQSTANTPATTIALPGCYSYTESIAQTATTKPVTVGAGAANEVVQVNALRPRLATAISTSSGQPGTTAYDNVSVTGTNGGRTTVTWTLVGPVALLNGACPAQGDPAWNGAAQIASGTIVVNGDGDYATNDPTATPPHGADTLAAVGCYSYADTLNSDAQGTITAATIPAGDAGETAQITPFQPQLATTAQATSALAGASLTDTVTITGLGRATPVLTWQLLGPLPAVNGSCANLDWTAAPSAGSGSVQTLAGTTQYDVGPTVLPQAGCYTYVEDLPGTALSAPAHSAAGQATETVLLNPYTPMVTTEADAGKDPKLGDKMHDSITVTNFGPAGNSADVTWTLFGPVVPAKGTSCAGIDWTSPSIPIAATGTITVSADGTFQSADVTIAKVGCYSYGDALAATTGSAAATLSAGDPTETLYVRALTKALTLHKLVKASVNSGSFIEADSSDHRSGAYEVGQTVTWKIVVTNTGEDVLHGVTVTDDQVKACVTVIGDLQPGAVAYFTCTSTAQAAMVNVAVATDRTKQAHDQNSARILVTSSLAVTGTDVLPMVVGGGLAVLVGLFLLLATRRRRES